MADNDSSPENDEEPEGDRLKRLSIWLGFWKFVLGSFVLAALTAILNYQIQSRTVTIKAKEQEKEYLKSFINQAMDDNLEKRLRFAQYFATLLKEGWTEYYKQLDQELALQKEQVERAKKEQISLASSQDPKAREKSQELERKITFLEANITQQLPAPAEAAELWSFNVIADHDDLVVNDVSAKPFGFPWDPLDNGQTASGTDLKANPSFQGCALPMGGFKLSVLAGSPLPKLPWQTVVRVTNLLTQKTVDLPLIDVGPPKRSGAAIALTAGAIEALGGDPKSITRVSYRVIGGAKNLPGKP
jgi:hypothetical protein